MTSESVPEDGTGLLICTNLIQCHSILNEQSDSRVKVAHIPLQDEILLGLC